VVSSRAWVPTFWPRRAINQIFGDALINPSSSNRLAWSSAADTKGKLNGGVPPLDSEANLV
jgi:hypothetical protein